MTKYLAVAIWAFVAIPLCAQKPDGPRKVSAEPRSFGTLTGRIVIDGERPQQEELKIPAMISDLKGNEYKLDSFEHYRSLGLKDNSLLVSDDGGLKNVIVWISDKNVPIPPQAAVKRLPAPVQLKFMNGQFGPHVLVYESWRVVELSNHDKYSLNIHCTLAADGFNVLLEPASSKKSTQTVNAAAQRMPSKVESSICPWAKAWIFPVEHPYFAVTGTDGNFRLDRLPIGEWEFRAWHERWGYLKTKQWPTGKFTQKIADGKNDLGTITFEIPKEEKPKP